MAQHDYNIANQSGAAFRADLNNALLAIVSQNSGTSAPSTTFAHQLWADTTTSTLKIRNAANSAWIELMQLDGTLTMEDGTALLPGLAFRDDLNTGLFSDAADTLGITTNGVERVEFGTSEVVFNDGGADVDFRIEGDTNANLFFVDAGNDRIGVGTSSPGQSLHLRNGSNPAIQIDDTTNSQFIASITSADAFGNGSTVGQLYLRGASGIGFTGNGGSSTGMVLDSSNRLGIGVTSAASILHVSGSGDQTYTFQTTTSGADNRINFRNSSGTDAGGIWYMHSGNHLLFNTGGSNGEKARIDGSGRLLVGTSSSRTAGTADLIQASHVSGSNIILNRQVAATGSAGDYIGGIKFYSYAGSASEEHARIWCQADDNTGSGDKPGRLVFSTTADGASAPTERMRITNGGSVLIKTTSVLAGRTNTPLQVNHGSSGNGTPSVVIGNNGGAGQRNLIEFLGSSSSNQVGLIHHDNSTTTYGTSSDYRLKENVVPLTGAADRLKQLKPSKFNFIANPDKTVDGFLAHEVQEVVPEAAYGEKDGVDDDGKPVYQGIDQSKLVPLLTAALQEALQKIETLEQRLTDAGIA